MPERGPKTLGPQNHIGILIAVAPGDAVVGESIEHRSRGHRAAIARRENLRDHHDVAESGDTSRVGVPGSQGGGAAGRDLKQNPPVDTVGQEPRWPQGHPDRGRGFGGDLGDELGGGVAATDHNDVRAAELVRGRRPGPARDVRCPVSGSMSPSR